MEDAINHHAGGGFTLTGKAIDIYQAATVRSALKMHIATGGRMRLSRNANPTHLMKLAAQITGRKFKARDYATAMTALDQWITETKVQIAQVQE